MNGLMLIYLIKYQIILLKYCSSYNKLISLQ